MKKDIFNGKIKSRYVRVTFFSILAAALLFLCCAIFFLCLGLFYAKEDRVAQIAMFVVAGLGFVCAVIFPVCTVACVRSYPKHKTLTHYFIKPHYLNNDETDEQN